MLRLRNKLTSFNLLSKLAVSALFMAFMPFLVERVNILQTDNELIKKREKVIELITEVGIDPFITTGTENTFGSYNILKEEFVSIEKTDTPEDWNFIEITTRLIEGETIEYRVLNYTFSIDGQKYLLETGKSLESIQFTRKSITRIMLVFLAFFILITLLSDLYYTIKVLRPLEVITGKLKATSDPSLFDRKPVKTTTSDFRSLDQTLIDLMDKIDELFKKEKEITVNISHELMTPISVMQGKLENLMLQQDIDPGVEERIEESLRTLHRLKSLVNSLLFIARIESRQYLKDDSFSVIKLMNEVTEELRLMADDAAIKIREYYGPDHHFQKANRSLVFSMFFNVLLNAIKNTPPDGEITLRSSVSNARVIFSVTDTGKGMTEEELGMLFSRFGRKLDVNGNGTGIGLAISRSIADFHGIQISVDSTPGEGTTFSFIMP